MDTRLLTIAAVVGGLAMALISNLPIIQCINCLACAGLWLSGGFAVWFYNNQGTRPASPPEGAIIGAASGLVGAIIGFIVGLIFSGVSSAIVSAVDTSGTFGDAVGGLVAGGIGGFIGLLVNIFLYPAFGAIGGAAAAVLLDRQAKTV